MRVMKPSKEQENKKEIRRYFLGRFKLAVKINIEGIKDARHAFHWWKWIKKM